jgi:methionyl-tRNA formyltransferase
MTLSSPRIAFMGTPDFAATILKALLAAAYPIVAVYTQPPRQSGRGYKLTPSPVQDIAVAHKIPVFTPPSLKTEDSQKEWQSLNIDIAIVAAYGLLLPSPILKVPRLGCVNIHASLLPRWRGAAPIQRALLAGDQETGITLMKMDKGLDTGDMIAKEKVYIDSSMTTPRLLEILTSLGADLLLKTLPLYLSGKVQPTPQPQEGVTYASKLTKEEGFLDWTLPAPLLERKVRALNPWPGTWFEVGHDRIKVLEAIALPSDKVHLPGTILDNKLSIACSEGIFRPLRVQKVGKSPLLVPDFLRGYEMPPILRHGAL